LATARSAADAAGSRLGRVRAARERAAAALLSAREAHEQAFAAWRAARALALATILVEGEPCPVCGSVSHPSPAATPAGTHGDDDQLERAARALHESQEADTETARLLAQAEAEAAVARSRVEERERQAVRERPDAGLESPPDADRLARLEADLAAARQAA